MPWVGFKPMIPELKRAEIVHALETARLLWSAITSLLIYLFYSSSSMLPQPDIGPWPRLWSPTIRGLIPGFETLIFFTVRGRQPLAQPPTWKTRVSLLVWIIPFDLSGMGGTTSSYATAGIALRVIWPHKPHHYVKVKTPSGDLKYSLRNGK
jgi:hypothetical protein